MTAHRCTILNPGCFRCDLNLDEMESDRLDHERVAKLLRRVAANPRRRPGTRGLLLDLADEVSEHAAEVQQALQQAREGQLTDTYGPHLATADDVIEGRARYGDTPGGRADIETRKAEALERLRLQVTCEHEWKALSTMGDPFESCTLCGTSRDLPIKTSDSEERR